MKKLFLYAALLCTGFASCTKEFLVPEGELPSWLGESIYEELQNPKSLDGTFNTYIKLIDDLGYAEVLGKTGSKTIFPANDEAFAKFFEGGNNKFGKSSYEQLTVSEKSQILFSTMLDNAILVGNLSSQQNSAGEMAQGRIVKHPTNIALRQSVEPLKPEDMPENNPSFAYWKKNSKSINALYDNTEAPMVHFTGEYMLNNAMTVTGPDNDFYVLTGQEYKDGDAFIFDHKIINSNITCQNGYIHQLDGVMVNPGNMAQIIRQNSDTKYLSRMLDYFACVRPMGLTFDQDYQQYSTGFGTQDSVYAVRYLAQNSQRGKLIQREQYGKIESSVLNFDPGWNYYNPTVNGSSDDQAEIAAILAPTDTVLERYFLHDGAYIVKNLGVPGLPNTKENLNQHLDAIFNGDPSVFASMLNNIMKPYLSKTVPSKFSTVQNDAFEFLNCTIDDIEKKADGKYNVQIANNGVIYKTRTFFGPELYNSVLGPASVYKDMRIMGKMLNDHQITPGTESTLGADMYYYLLSMKARYALFVPTDNEDFFYIDPASVNDADGMKALKFIFDPTSKTQFGVLVQVYSYDEATNTLTPHSSYPAPIAIETGGFNSQIKDMLNYHTVVLEGQNALGGNRYYLTKHGGAIYVPDMTASSLHSSKVLGGEQISAKANASVVTEIFSATSEDAKITNGTVYRLNTPIQPTTKSIYKTLSDSKYADFLEFCEGFGEEDVLYWCGILSDSDSKALHDSKLSKYKIFGEKNVMSILGTYNYTIYAPQDMKEAYNHGLPTWEEVNAIVTDWEANKSKYGFDTEADAKAYVKACIDKMHDFVMYHVQNNSVFDDVVLNTAKNQTFYTNELGIAKTLQLSKGGSGTTVVDAVTSGRSSYPTIVEPNMLARDVTTTQAMGDKFVDTDNNRYTYNRIVSSSFVVIHGIDKPLCYNANYKY